ncbi:MAG TPA: hypothetical protein VK096_02320, partial [Actinomycetales bacterium]|nr:hypothetical protein [Actinomycetales bacterium]
MKGSHGFVGKDAAMRKLRQWLEEKRKVALYVGGAVALLLVVALGWLTFGGESEQPHAQPSQGTGSRARPDSGAENRPDEDESTEVGPATLPDSNVSQEIAEWGVADLAPIEATTDPIEFAEKFGQVWMAPNYQAYDKADFLEWVEQNFAANDGSARATQSARVSILDQIAAAEDWEIHADEGTVQAAQILSVEEPEWVRQPGSKAQRFLTEAHNEGWPNTTLIEAYALVYTQ